MPQLYYIDHYLLYQILDIYIIYYYVHSYHRSYPNCLYLKGLNQKNNNNLYLGTGQTISGNYGTFWNISVDLTEVSKNPKVIKEVKTEDGSVKKFLNLKMGKLKKPFNPEKEHPTDMYISWNDYEPEKTVEDKEGSNLPF